MKVIPDTENRYSITEDGVVFSHLKQDNLKPQNFEGYRRVHLWYKGAYHLHRVHRLVAATYLPNPNHYPEVNHKDKNRANNHVSNLEWCTSKQNSDHKLIGKRTVSINQTQGLKLIALLIRSGVPRKTILENISIEESLINEARKYLLTISIAGK